MTQANGQFTPRFGTIRTGSDFFPDAIPNPDQLVTDLTNGTSVAVFGLRRIGKSSLLKETGERLRALGKKVIWVSTEQYDTPSKTLAAILHSLHGENKKGLYSKLRYWLDNSKIVPVGLKTKAGALATATAKRLAKNYDENYIEIISDQTIRFFEDHGPDIKPIIIFDEFTTLIKRTIEKSKKEDRDIVVGRLNSFLGLLRSLRILDAGVTMAISGSVSLDWLREEHGIKNELINDCFDRRIQELDRDGARRLFEMCLDAVSLPNWNEQFTEELLDFLPAYYPGVVQLAFYIISTEPTPVATLDDSIKFTINEGLWDNYYEQFELYFKQYSDSEQSRISKLFGILATKENGVIDVNEALDILHGVDLAKDELRGRDIMNRLKSCSFIRIAGSSGIRFTSGLVPAWHNSKKTKKDN